MPSSADGLVEDVTQALDRSVFPKVFEGLGPEPIAPVEAPDGAVTADPDVTRALASVVHVRAESDDCGQAQVGSGWVVAPGRIATNAHVVAGADRVTVSVRGTGRERAARVVAFDPRRDVAVLDVSDLRRPSSTRGRRWTPGPRPPSPASPATTGCGSGRPGCATCCGPEGADIYGNPDVTRQIYSLRAQVRRGASGGPVIDRRGDVVGMVFATSLDDPDTGYALTLDEIAPVLRRGVLGLTDGVDRASACQADGVGEPRGAGCADLVARRRVPDAGGVVPEAGAPGVGRDVGGIRVTERFLDHGDGPLGLVDGPLRRRPGRLEGLLAHQPEDGGDDQHDHGDDEVAGPDRQQLRDAPGRAVQQEDEPHQHEEDRAGEQAGTLAEHLGAVGDLGLGQGDLAADDALEVVGGVGHQLADGPLLARCLGCHARPPHCHVGPTCTGPRRRPYPARAATGLGGSMLVDVGDAVGVVVARLQLGDPPVDLVADAQQDRGEQGRQQGADEHGQLDAVVALGAHAEGELAHRAARR